jgi:hypothetical protein
MGRMRLRTAVVSLVAAGSLLGGGALAAPALATASQPSSTGIGSTGNGTLDALILTVQRLLLPGCLEAELGILLNQGGTPGPCLG